MKITAENGFSSRTFIYIVNKPKVIIIIGLLVIIASSFFIGDLVKDTRPNTFLAPDNPALLYREKVKELFGLSDPLIVAVVNKGENGVFNPETLALLGWLSQEISVLPNIDDSRLLSLATENNITGTEDGMDVRPFFDPVPATQAEADALRRAVNDFPLYLGTLVARDGKTTLIIVELLDEFQVQETYQQVARLVESKFQDTPITAVSSVSDSDKLRLTFVLNQVVHPDAYVLAPYLTRGHRLVVDMSLGVSELVVAASTAPSRHEFGVSENTVWVNEGGMYGEKVQVHLPRNIFSSMKVSFDGLWEQEWAVETGSGESQKFEAVIEPYVNIVVSQSLSITGIARIRLDGIGDLGPSAYKTDTYSTVNGPWSNTEHTELSLRELYFDAEWGGASGVWVNSRWFGGRRMELKFLMWSTRKVLGSLYLTILTIREFHCGW